METAKGDAQEQAQENREWLRLNARHLEVAGLLERLESASAVGADSRLLIEQSSFGMVNKLAGGSCNELEHRIADAITRECLEYSQELRQRLLESTGREF